MNNDKTQTRKNARENTEDTLGVRKDAWQRPAVTRLDAAPDTRAEVGTGMDGQAASELNN